VSELTIQTVRPPATGAESLPAAKAKVSDAATTVLPIDEARRVGG
jgi:hypothetical protein